jgi:hypothetical protein
MEIIQQLTFAVEEGNMSALDAYIQLHQIEKLAGEARKQIQAQAVTEAQREGKQFTRMGFEVQCRAGAGRWKFDHISEWEAKKFELSQVEEKAKWAFKSAEKGITPIDDDGVIIEAAIYTPGADTIALKEVQA